VKPETHNPKLKARNWNLLFLVAGLVLLAVGYVVLAMANETAGNLAGRLSPFLILGAYATIFISLIRRSAK
jgi:hypothetical protein